MTLEALREGAAIAASQVARLSPSPSLADRAPSPIQSQIAAQQLEQIREQQDALRSMTQAVEMDARNVEREKSEKFLRRRARA